MKKIMSTVIITGLFGISAFAGTSSAGGLMVPEQGVTCALDNQQGHEIQLQIFGDASVEDTFIAQVQEASTVGLYMPVEFTNLARIPLSETLVSYEGEGFSLLVNLATGTTSIPPMYESTLRAEGVAGNQILSLPCQLVEN